MASSSQTAVSPLLLPEIVGLVLDYVDLLPDLLSCACVNRIWNELALKKLYQGSLTDLRYCTPDIGSLNGLFIASRERFARNMSFVRHLLLSSDRLWPVKYDESACRLACTERIRSLRHRQDAEVLLRPRSRCLVSLMMPFPILGQDWSSISDLLLSQTVRFLAIDILYCDHFIAPAQSVRQPAQPLGSIPLRNHFPNLKALTVYKHEHQRSILKLLDLIVSCDLEFFHLEEHGELSVSSLGLHDLASLLDCLQLHSNLKTLVLRVKMALKIIGENNYTSTWPKLKALYLEGKHEARLEQISNLAGLEVLSLRTIGLNHINIDNAIETITKCQYLRSIDIDIRDADSARLLLAVTHSCHNLRNCRAKCGPRGWWAGGPSSTDFLDLIRSLPQLEFLELDWRLVYEGDAFRDLAVYCPKLTILKVPHISVLTSFAQLEQAPPLQYLEIMQLENVHLRDSWCLIERKYCRMFISKWRRIFPKLRAVPCPADISNQHMEQKDLNNWTESSPNAGEEEMLADVLEEQEGEVRDLWARLSVLGQQFDALLLQNPAGANYNRFEATAEATLESSLDRQNSRYDSSLVRIRLWRELNYALDEDIYDRAAAIWQRNFEVENMGWPVLPLEAFTSQALDVHFTLQNRGFEDI